MLYGLEHTQPEAAGELEKLLNTGTFPSASLFCGEPCSGRMYAALAVARHFGADEDSTVIVSDRSYGFRTAAALSLFSKHGNNASKKFLSETVSAFLKQYHGALLVSQSAANRKKFSDAAACAELVSRLPAVKEEEAASFSKQLEKALSPLIDFSKATAQTGGGAVTVGNIRALRDWCAESSLDGKDKIIIIEGLENAGEPVSNALLKTLEEPPRQTYFILISSNAGRIPATILSRVRRFRFNSFGEKEKNYVLNGLFVNASEYPDISSFFLQYAGVNDSLLRQGAAALVKGEALDLPAIVRELERTQVWERFFSLVINGIKDSFENGTLDRRRSAWLLNEISTAVSKGKAYNQNGRLTFDFVVFRTMEAVRSRKL